MGEPTDPPPALLLMAAFSRYKAAIRWARDRAAEAWGPVARESCCFQFAETDYYRPTMGSPLGKVFFAFARPFDPGDLAEVKLQTNRWEQEYAQRAGHAEPRPLNLDPGYLTLGKLVLASTKDHTHRIYLGRGIYGEVTLYYRHGGWEPHQWTFADYRRDGYQQFFSECRELLSGERTAARRREGSAK